MSFPKIIAVLSKFVDDTKVVGLISGGDGLVFRKEVAGQVSNLSFNIKKQRFTRHNHPTTVPYKGVGGYLKLQFVHRGCDGSWISGETGIGVLVCMAASSVWLACQIVSLTFVSSPYAVSLYHFM